MTLTLEQELSELLNSHNADSETQTPDYILATYLLDCMRAFRIAMEHREAWNARHPETVL